MAIAPQENKEVSFFKTSINGINALSGIGILSVPYALSSGGWLSLLILLSIASAACFTAILIRRCMDKDPDIKSYIDIAGHAFGRKGRVIATLFTCFELYFVATGLLILEGDNLHKLSPNFSIKLGKITVDGRHSFIVLAGVMILPSMFLNDLGVLSYISAGGVLSSLILIICVICIGVSKGVGFHGKGTLFHLHGIPTALSLYTFCYGAHAMFPPIYNSMKKKSKFPEVLFLSFVICTVTYVTMAILGYTIYGQNVKAQVTLNLPTNIVSSKVAIYTILVTPIAKYALTVIPIVEAIESRLPSKYQENRVVNLVIKMSLLLSTVIVAVVFPSFQSVTSLSGSALIVVVSFLLPSLCYLKIFEAYKNVGFELVGVVFIMLMAVFVGVLGTYSSIAQTVKHI